MKPFWKSHTYAIIKHMKAKGNQPGVVACWVATISKWADDNAGLAEAAAIKTWLPYWRARPFYTATELAPIFPALAIVLSISNRLHCEKSSVRLANELTFGGLPKLKNANHTTYFYNVGGIIQEYFIVEQIHKWSKVALTQEEFDNVLFG